MAAAIGLAVLVALAWAAEPAWYWRALGAGLGIILAWGPARDVLLGLGSRAVRRFEWDGRGSWSVMDRAGRAWPVALEPSSMALGSWLLLVWRKEGSGFLRALVDASRTDRRAFRTLKGRLNC